MGLVLISRRRGRVAIAVEDADDDSVDLLRGLLRRAGCEAPNVDVDGPFITRSIRPPSAFVAVTARPAIDNPDRLMDGIAESLRGDLLIAGFDVRWG